MGIPEDYNNEVESLARINAIAEHAKEAERKAVPPMMEPMKQKSTMTTDSLQECVSKHLKKDTASMRE